MCDNSTQKDHDILSQKSTDNTSQNYSQAVENSDASKDSEKTTSNKDCETQPIQKKPKRKLERRKDFSMEVKGDTEVQKYYWKKLHEFMR